MEVAKVSKEETILEIGPGEGALTELLLNAGKRVICVEIDRDLEKILTKKFGSNPNFTLIMQDILTIDFHSQIGEKVKVVANIPYYITSPIITKLIENKEFVEDIFIMVQKEVAERIVAKNKKTGGQGKESILSIAVKVYGEPEYICTVKAGNFTPAPKIDSAVIKINNISREKFLNKHHEEVFFQIMKAGFAHKRKTLAGNLKNILEPELVTAILSSNNISPSVRAEDLGINDWLILAQLVYNNQYVTE
jgi:16S rRNA (adenine1518-N6/adenine1519-N6)-dimethyltransferase